MSKCLTTCRSCCKFDKGDRYFAPKITYEEINNIKSVGLYKPVFRSFDNSKKVFQISLIKSKFSKNTFICSYLNEDTQACEIHGVKPFDCDFWPFLFMYDEKGEKMLIAHFDKDMCQTTDAKSKKQFKNYLDENLNRWIKEKNVIELINKYPDLVWDYEPQTFIVKEIKLTK